MLYRTPRAPPDMASKPATHKGAGRTGFLNASRSAAISETIKKEERALYCMLQKQIELGRIVLPPEDEEGEAEGTQGDNSFAPADPSIVGKQVAWLLAAHRGAGQPLPWDGGAGEAQAPASGQEIQDEGQRDGAGRAETAAGGPEARATAEAQEAAEVWEQMRSISRSLWSTVSLSASGAGSYTSRNQADYQYHQEAVAAMQRGGELTSEHHRKRDVHSAYMEASARDAALRRGSSDAKLPGGA